MSVKLTGDEKELLRLLKSGPRYGFTDTRALDTLTSKGLAKSSYEDHQMWGYLTEAGRALLAQERTDGRDA